MKEGCNKFKEKYEDDYQCAAQLTTQHSQYIKLYPLQNASPHVLPPPFTASTRGEQRQLALERRNANTSD